MNKKQLKVISLPLLLLSLLAGCSKGPVEKEKEMQTLEKSLITLEDSGKFKTITFDVSFIKDNYDIPYLSMKNLTDFFC